MTFTLTGAAATAKGRAEKPSTDLGPSPTLDWIPVAKLSVDRRYQRELGDKNRAHINRIVREFNWLFFQPICVAPAATGGGYLVIDGQHRLEAAKKHPLIDKLPCYVVAAPDVQKQAEAFVALNARRIGITRLHRFWAAEASGDATAQRITALCAKAGITIVRSPQRLPPRSTYSTTTFEKLLPLGDAAISVGLRILVDAQGEAEDAFKGCNIAAVVRLAATLGKALGSERRSGRRCQNKNKTTTSRSIPTIHRNGTMGAKGRPTTGTRQAGATSSGSSGGIAGGRTRRIASTRRRC